MDSGNHAKQVWTGKKVFMSKSVPTNVVLIYVDRIILFLSFSLQVAFFRVNAELRREGLWHFEEGSFLNTLSSGEWKVYW